MDNPHLYLGPSHSAIFDQYLQEKTERRCQDIAHLSGLPAHEQVRALTAMFRGDVQPILRHEDADHTTRFAELFDLSDLFKGAEAGPFHCPHEIKLRADSRLNQLVNELPCPRAKQVAGNAEAGNHLIECMVDRGGELASSPKQAKKILAVHHFEQTVFTIGDAPARLALKVRDRIYSGTCLLESTAPFMSFSDGALLAIYAWFQHQDYSRFAKQGRCPANFGQMGNTTVLRGYSQWLIGQNLKFWNGRSKSSQ